MKKMGNFGALMSAVCLFAAMISAQHDYRNHIARVQQTSLTDSVVSLGSYGVEYTSTSLMK